MALAVVVAGLLRATLPAQLRNGDAWWLFLVVMVVLLGALVVGDPGRIDRDVPWLRVLTSVLIGLMTAANADAAVRLVISIVDTSPFTNDAKVLLAAGGAVWLTNVIAFSLWYWALDRGGPAARAIGAGRPPALVFPEMKNEEHVGPDWSPVFVDYFHFGFATATAFSPTDVSAIRPWMKLMMIAEESISLIVALLVVARAVNILK
jgi:drug/metabolite transporter (DMT)-like permease